MIPPKGWRRVFRNPFRDRTEQEAIHEEVELHLHELAERHLREGQSPEQAWRSARAEFGDPVLWAAEALAESRKRVKVQQRRVALLGLRADLRMAGRQIVKRPFFTTLMLIVMTLGIAGGTTVWAVVDAVLMRPLPIRNPDRVVAVMGANRRSESWWVSRFAYESWDRAQRSFRGMAAIRDVSMTLLEPFPQEIGALQVESRFFDLIGVQPFMGRAFTREEDLSADPNLLILTHALWRERFSSDPNIIGRRIDVSGGPATVVGVMPPSFSWEAIQWDNPAREGAERLALRNGIFRSDPGILGSAGRFLPLGRLRPGVSVEQARADLLRVGQEIADTYPEEYVDSEGTWLPNVRPLRWIWTRFNREDVLLLGWAALLMLFLVAVNGASLLVTRVLDRRTELALRASLGAGRRRLARQVLVETGVLWAVALALGLVAAGAALPWIRTITPPAVSFTDNFTLTQRVVVGATGFAVVLWLLSAALPAFDGSRVDLVSISKSGASTVRRGKAGIQRVLIVGQIALACGLLSGAALIMRSYAALRGVEIGLDPEGTAVLYVELPARYREPAGTVGEAGGVAEYAREWFSDDSPVYRPGPLFQQFVTQTLQRMEAVPGVEGATFVNQAPLWESLHWRGIRLAPPGEEPDESDPWVRLKWVSPDYFETLGIPVLRGRPFRPSDSAESEDVVIVNEAVAWHLFGDADPLGRSIPVGISAYFPPEERTIVGVVPPVLHYGPHEPSESVLYIPVAQIPQAWADDQIGFAMRATFLARYRGERGEVMQGLREAVWAAEPELPITRESTLEEQYFQAVSEPRFFLVLLSSFAALALVLSAVGVLATLGQHVRQRTGELGLRKALGADTSDLLRRTLGEGAVLGTIGIVVGAGLAWAVARGLAAQVVGISGLSPAVLVAVGLLLVGVSVAAAFPAGLRASRVDPMEALRTE